MTETTTAVRVRVPATSANLGPAFDSLALALSLHNEFEIRLSEQGLQIENQGEGAELLPTDDSNLVVRAIHSVFEQVGREPSGFQIKASNQIPPGSGLGSSASAIVAGVVGANALLGNPLSSDDLLLLAAELEGHADNTSAALLGGLTALTYSPGRVVARRLSVPNLKVALATPQADVSTAMQRASLPSQIPLREAAVNIGRSLLIVEALSQGDYDLLGEVMHDHIHQPYRRRAIPGINDAWNAADESGAAAVAISGAGPSLIAFAPEGHAEIAKAMADAFSKGTGSDAQYMVLDVDGVGADAQPLNQPVS